MKHCDALPDILWPLLVRLNWLTSYGTNNSNNFVGDNNVLLAERIKIRDGRESEPSKNEPNQNPAFAKNRIEPESKKCARTRTEPCPVKNRTEPEPKCRGSYLVLSLNEIVHSHISQ